MSSPFLIPDHLRPIERFYVLSMRNDDPKLSYWVVRDRKQKLEDKEFHSQYVAQAYCKVKNSK